MKETIKAVLLDLDGTLYFKGQAIPGAREAIAELRESGLQLRFLTNTDSRRTETLYERVRAFGLDIRLEEIHTPVVAAANYARGKPGAKVFALVSDEVIGCFENQAGEGEVADIVIIGDFSGKVGYELMNRAFRHIDAGAEIVALQKGRFFHSPEGKNLDTGAFVAAFEYASGKAAKVLGKPSGEFFMSAIEGMGLSPSQVMIVGDDCTTDIQGALEVGAVPVLVQTGKYDAALAETGAARARHVIPSVGELVALIRG